MRKPYQSPGSDEKLILLYCPGRGSNSRPPAHRSFEHGQGVPRATEAVNDGEYCDGDCAAYDHDDDGEEGRRRRRRIMMTRRSMMMMGRGRGN